MNAWNLTVAATLDRAPSQLDAKRLGAVAGAGLLSTMVHDTKFAVSALLDGPDPVLTLRGLSERLRTAFAELGYEFQRWEALECLSVEESEQRLAAASLPEMVNTERFAEICGVSRQRISELETERRAAAREGRTHAFPAPLVPGWWVKTAAEHYAQNRKRKPGPAPRTGQNKDTK